MSIAIIDDEVTEPAESFALRLRDASGIELGQIVEAKVRVLDDDIELDRSERLEAQGAESPAAASSPEGRKALVWTEPDGDGRGIFAQLIGIDGDPESAPFSVAGSSVGDQSSPAVAWDADERLVITWLSDRGVRARPPGRVDSFGSTGSGTSILGRTFGPTGSPTSGELDLGGNDATAPSDPAVDVDKSGEIVVTWEEPEGPRGRVIDRDGTPRASFQIDVALVEGAAQTQVAKSPTGDFLAVWVSDEGIGGIRARLFDRSGIPRSDAFFVIPDADARAPDVAASENGDYIVVWEASTAAQGLDVFAQRYDDAARPLSSPFPVNSETTGDQRRPRVDANAVGDFVVVFESDPSGTLSGGTSDATSILGRFFDPTGTSLGGDVEVATTEAGLEPQSPDVTIDDRDETVVVFERRNPDGSSNGVFSQDISPSIATAECDEEDATSLCLTEARFRVRAEWRTESGDQGFAEAVPLTSDTGTYWFFDEANIELVVKVLDACLVNEHYWVFAGGLTDLEVNLTVDDVVSGQSRTYFNRQGEAFAPVTDTSAFPTCDDDSGVTPPTPTVKALSEILSRFDEDSGRLGIRLETELESPGTSSCTETESALCLSSGRFEVRASFTDPTGATGDASSVPLTEDTGYFWFFVETNVELVVKVLDGCGVNGNLWVFAGGLTDVAVTLTVTDTVTGAVQVYESSLGVPFTPIRDTSAFAACDQ